MTWRCIGGVAPHIFYLCNTRWWVVSFMFQPLHPWGKNPWYSMDRWPGGPQSQIEHWSVFQKYVSKQLPSNK